MDIAEVVKRTGVPAHTLRFYEKKGLITSISPPGIRRQFPAAVIEQLAPASYTHLRAHETHH
ncbi:MerR family DNA-binding transcriptional regulator, partial [Pseudomonas carnis]|uniref:MerR family DNA-binding transcriptional regulator n=1 Tax=Pseudomonas carnis TaxID=2487355 RepID=UPI001F0062B6